MNERQINKGVLALSKIFCTAGYTLYLVGGCVRNITLGLPEGDFDVCSAVLPHEASVLLKSAGCTVIEKALSLGTIEVHLTLDGQKYVFEHTTFRRDYYPQGGAHRPYKVEFTKDIAEDARRRDFAMNALYLNIEENLVTDPTGSGQSDIQKKIIKAAASNPIDTIRDDGLRIMRMVRFAAQLGFTVSQDLMACAVANAHLLRDISAERKYIELKKILMADTKYCIDKIHEKSAHQRGMEMLRDIGALPYVLPRFSEGEGVAQSQKYHAYDVLGHGIHACAASQPSLPLRLAALLHDIGKPRALEQTGKMLGHDEIGEALAREELCGLKADNQTKSIVTALVRNHMFDLDGKAKPKTIRKRAVKLGEQTFEMLIALRRADFAGSGKCMGNNASADNWQKELERMKELGVPWSLRDLAIDGSEIQRLLCAQPSPKIGKILDNLFWECVSRPAMNKKEILTHRVTTIVKSV